MWAIRRARARAKAVSWSLGEEALQARMEKATMMQGNARGGYLTSARAKARAIAAYLPNLD